MILDKQNPNGKYPCKVNLRFSPDMYAFIEKRVKKEEKSVTEYLRDLVNKDMQINNVGKGA